MPVTLAALFNHPHPLLRALVVLMVFGLVFGLLGAALYAHYRHHAELSARLKSLEDKVDGLATPPTPPITK